MQKMYCQKILKDNHFHSVVCSLNNINFSFVLLNLTLHKFNGKTFQSLILINLYLIRSVKTVISHLKDVQKFCTKSQAQVLLLSISATG